MRIYSRWGELVYERNNFDVNTLHQSWDGTLLGVELNLGVFIYTIEAEAKNGQILNIDGEVLLLRWIYKY